MFVTCHITFGQLSNFVGASLEVTRTIRNNKLHFTWGCSILLLKKGKGPWDRIPFFFLMILTFFKNILILIITSLAIHYSQNVFRGFSNFFTPHLARDPLSRSPRACLRLTEKRWKIAPVLQIQASSMKLRVSSFLSFFISKRMVKTNSSVFTHLFIVMCIFWSCCLSFI